jgi:hypothetical protein
MDNSIMRNLSQLECLTAYYELLNCIHYRHIGDNGLDERPYIINHSDNSKHHLRVRCEVTYDDDSIPTMIEEAEVEGVAALINKGVRVYIPLFDGHNEIGVRELIKKYDKLSGTETCY